MIFYKTTKHWLDYQEKRWQEEKEIIDRRNKLKEARKGKKKKIETSKIVLWFMLFLLLSIILFTGYVTISMMNIAAYTNSPMDFTPLVALISAIVGQVIITLGYFIKSSKENQEGGITYLNAQYNLENDGGVG